MDDASLDDFVDGDASGDDRDDAGSERADERETETESPAVDPSTVEPAVSTYAWDRDPVACAACGEPVEKRWRDDGELVCADCKEW